MCVIEYLKYLNKVDTIDNARIAIDLVHHEIHEGNYYSATVIDTDVDTAAPKYVRITAPNTAARIHFTGMVYATAAGLVEFYENPTLNAAGTAVTIFNNDRNSIKTATATVFYDTTTQAPNNDGTRIDAGRVGGAARPNFRIGGETARRNEWILKQAEDYILKFTPDADNTEFITVLSWYEVI